MVFIISTYPAKLEFNKLTCCLTQEQSLFVPVIRIFADVWQKTPIKQRFCSLNLELFKHARCNPLADIYYGISASVDIT
jgi:hypothetical protein